MKAAGHILGIAALQNHAGTYTGNMRSALTKAGFQALTASKYLNSGEYLLPGDILLNDAHHKATNITVGAKVKNSWNPGTAVILCIPLKDSMLESVPREGVEQICDGLGESALMLMFQMRGKYGCR